MFKKVFPILLLLMLLAVVIGCAGGNSLSPTDPASPSVTQANADQVDPAQNHYLWGLWQAYVDPERGELEFEPMRGAEFHLNVTGRLQPPNPPGLTVKMNSIDPVLAALDVDLTLTHPYPKTNFRGFDVRGIVMGSGPLIMSKGTPSATFTDPTGMRLDNADGYTRWWNPTEFGTPGMFGFVPGAAGTKGLISESTINPYKYFADYLFPTANVTPWVDSTNRGTFSTSGLLGVPMTVTRNYKLHFPIVGGKPAWKFQYAVDANFAFPTGSSSTPKPIGDYPPEANCPEAYHIAVDASKSTTFYNSNTDNGGNVVLTIEVFDWGAPSDPNGTDDEIQSIQIESLTLFDDVVNVPVLKTAGSQPESGKYNITVENVHPTGFNNQEVLVTVVSKYGSYQPPVAGPKYPQSALAAFSLVSIPIKSSNSILVTSPNGGEVWGQGTTKDITWQSGGSVGSTVKISYNISGGTDNIITPSAPNTGTYSWNPLPMIESAFVKVKVTSVATSSIFDQSDNYFTIGTAGIHITSPNGGETLPGNGSWDITWGDTDPVANVKIELSTDGGASYPDVIVAGTPDDGLYTWNPIPAIDTTTAKIRISDVLNASYNDVSDNNFKIVASGETITVTKPNGGEIVQAGGSYEINWEFTGTPGNVKIELSTDSGATYPTTIIDNTQCDGSYMWDPVPQIESTTARIKISTVSPSDVSDESNENFTITSSSENGWFPVPDETDVLLNDPAPNQGEGAVDIMVNSDGADQSRGSIVDQTAGNIFYKYNDDYTMPTGPSWQYPVEGVQIHKFDTLLDGSVAFVTLLGNDAWDPPSVNDPIHGFFSASNTSTGATNVVFLGDAGDVNDPDQAPWSFIPDFSSGVPGGMGDNLAYFFRVFSPKAGNPVPHNGTIGLIFWLSPFTGADIGGWNVNISTQGGGVGPIDDTEPAKMALAVDDNSGLAIGEKAAATYWILDSTGKVWPCVIALETGSNIVMATPLGEEQVGSRTVIDIEIANAKDFGYSVTDPGFNWLAALLDNKNGTWSVGIWEYNYLSDPPAFTEIGMTEPIEGTPQALDVDTTDFEIHVLARKAGNKIHATVFGYNP
jgi:hypothetical protein